MDETDHKILALLKENARIPLSHISQEIGLSSPSIKDRIEKMESTGVIQGYKPVIDYSQLGLGITAFVRLTLQYPVCCQENIADVIKEIPEVVEGHYTDGDEDMLLKVVTESPRSLRDTLNNINMIPGVAYTKATISLDNPIRAS
ncbi:MAG: Lrp/AsnC family transcriptional regulator [Candidatus Bathyarchaeota archaeon]|nr:Lrp/AsnC family transcriptional regulator [Candidatus Bathyarchaeota archaeon]